MLCPNFETSTQRCTRLVLRFCKSFGSILILLTTVAAVGSVALSQSSQGADAAGNSARFISSTLTHAASREPGNSMHVNGHTFSARNLSFVDIVAFAWNLHPTQIQVGPEWTHEERFDFTGDAGAGSAPNVEQWRAMVRELVSRRFQIKTHHDQKLLLAFVVSLARKSPQLTVDANDPNGLPSISISPGELNARNATMADFTETLQRSVLDGPVIDRTGLPGKYNFTLEWDADENGADKQGEVTARNLASAMRKLGLKLDKEKTSVDVLVVDELSRPALN